ncbi:hypothetical protein HXX76_006832 [Chlamydomonas incerta]|uniref:Guanylate cyclase domain-containing protein n=1 Tax=Chlamydomonas incerta TaxID=51695 RepID=A0A835W3E7_CHLIN|nr:hypothetical protein HXX76_006832 [Chlamydomonas incerta]|eukprot:KAG2435629.1 hypothetical protein HXX76_006832 [Chlamydomonas incerta]
MALQRVEDGGVWRGLIQLPATTSDDALLSPQPQQITLGSELLLGDLDNAGWAEQAAWGEPAGGEPQSLASPENGGVGGDFGGGGGAAPSSWQYAGPGRRRGSEAGAAGGAAGGGGTGTGGGVSLPAGGGPPLAALRQALQLAAYPSLARTATAASATLSGMRGGAGASRGRRPPGAGQGTGTGSGENAASLPLPRLPEGVAVEGGAAAATARGADGALAAMFGRRSMSFCVDPKDAVAMRRVLGNSAATAPAAGPRAGTAPSSGLPRGTGGTGAAAVGAIIAQATRAAAAVRAAALTAAAEAAAEAAMTSSSGVASKAREALAPSDSDLSRLRPEAGTGGGDDAYGSGGGGGGWATAARDGCGVPSPAGAAPGKGRPGPAAPSGSGADAAAVAAAAAEAEAAGAGSESRMSLGRAAAAMASSAESAAAASAAGPAAGIASANASVSATGPSPRISHVSTHDAPAFEAVSTARFASARANSGAGTAPASIAAAAALDRRAAGAGGASTGPAAGNGSARTNRVLSNVTAPPPVMYSLPLAPCSPAPRLADARGGGTLLDTDMDEPAGWSVGGTDAGADGAAAATGKQPPSTGGGMVAAARGSGGSSSGAAGRPPRKAASLLFGPSSLLRTGKASSTCGSPVAPQSRPVPLGAELAEALNTSTFGRHHRGPARRCTTFRAANGGPAAAGVIAAAATAALPLPLSVAYGSQRYSHAGSARRSPDGGVGRLADHYSTPQPMLPSEYGGWDPASPPQLDAQGPLGGAAVGAGGGAGLGAGGAEAGATLAAARATTPPFGRASTGAYHHHHYHRHQHHQHPQRAPPRYQSQQLLQLSPHQGQPSPQPNQPPRRYTGGYTGSSLADEVDRLDAFCRSSNPQLQLHTLNVSVGAAGASIDGAGGRTSAQAGRTSAMGGRSTVDGGGGGGGGPGGGGDTADFPLAEGADMPLHCMEGVPLNLQASPASKVQSVLQVSAGSAGGGVAQRAFSHLAVGTGALACASSGTTGGTGASPSPPLLHLGPAGSTGGGLAANTSGPGSSGIGALPRLLDMTFKSTLSRVPSRARTPGGTSGHGLSNMHSAELTSSGHLLSSGYGGSRVVNVAGGGSGAGPRASVGGEGTLSTGLSGEAFSASGAAAGGAGGGGRVGSGSTPHAPQVARLSDGGELWGSLGHGILGHGSVGHGSIGPGSGAGSTARGQGPASQGGMVAGGVGVGGVGGGAVAMAWACASPSGAYDAAGSGSPGSLAAGGGGGMGAGGGRLASRHSSRSGVSRFRSVDGDAPTGGTAPLDPIHSGRLALHCDLDGDDDGDGDGHPGAADPAAAAARQQRRQQHPPEQPELAGALIGDVDSGDLEAALSPGGAGAGAGASPDVDDLALLLQPPLRLQPAPVVMERAHGSSPLRSSRREQGGGGTVAVVAGRSLSRHFFRSNTEPLRGLSPQSSHAPSIPGGAQADGVGSGGAASVGVVGVGGSTVPQRKRALAASAAGNAAAEAAAAAATAAAAAAAAAAAPRSSAAGSVSIGARTGVADSVCFVSQASELRDSGASRAAAGAGGGGNSSLTLGHSGIVLGGIDGSAGAVITLAAGALTDAAGGGASSSSAALQAAAAAAHVMAQSDGVAPAAVAGLAIVDVSGAAAAAELAAEPAAAVAAAQEASREHAMPTLTMEVWHEVVVSGLAHPVTGARLILVTQHDVSARVWAEQQLARVMEAEHALLEAIFPAHVLEHIAIMAAAPADAVERDSTVQEAAAAAANAAAANAASAANARPKTLENIMAEATAAALEAGLGLGGCLSSANRGVSAAAGSAAGRGRALGGVVVGPPGAAMAGGANAAMPITGDGLLHLATNHSAVSILFCDIQGFTAMCNMVKPATVMAFLNDLFTRLDALLDAFGVYKVETIGDCYMVAGGLMKVDEETGAVTVRSDDVDPLHAYRTVQFAKALLRAASSVRLPTTGEPVKLRVGIHSGSAMSGVVGTRMPRFCLFGDTVNTASRMESTGEAGAIHVSKAVFDLVPGEAWEPTGGVQAKGKGVLETYKLRPTPPT